MSCVFYSNLSVFSEEAPPPPVVYSRYTDDTIRFLAKKLKERIEILKEKAIDPYATSPEVTPPVSKCGQKQASMLREKNNNMQTNVLSHRMLLFCLLAPILRKDDYIRLKEEERIAKEEAEKKKAEEAAKKAEEKKKKDEEKRLEAEKKAEEERLAEEAKKKERILPQISCSCFDVLFHPVEEKMDVILGTTIDPFTGRHHT